MPRLVTYRCPDCTNTFDFLHHPSDEPPPSHCPLCKSDMTAPAQKMFVPKVNIGTAKGKIPDKLFKDMMTSSEDRAKDAADMAGCSVSDLPGIKITDMNDHLREGDVAAKRDPWAEHRIKTAHEQAAAQAAASLSHVKVGNQYVATGQGPQHAATTRPANPNQRSPEAQGWAESATTGPAAQTTRGIIENMQVTGQHGRMIAAATAKGQQAKA